MKHIFLSTIVSSLIIYAGLYSFLCCFSESEHIETVKEGLNKAVPITIDPRINKTKLLCRYKTRKENNIHWRAAICSNKSECISINEMPELSGIHDPNNFLIWYEWLIEAKKPGTAELRLEEYKNAQLQRTQYVKVEVID